MAFEWAAIVLSDVTWIALAFVMGLLSRLIGLPPLVGFLAAGFLLNSQGVTNNAMLDKLADLGITLLLFTVGLKLNLQTLARPQVWAVTSIHMSIISVIFGAAIYGLALLGLPHLFELDLQSSLLIGFALSFSSTVFVVKALEEKGELASLHGRIAIGILIMQDVAAVAFLAISTGKLPSPYAISLLLLIPLRPFIHTLLQRAGHGELLTLYGFTLALGGAEIFELVGVKGDLGALILGVMIASHAKAEEMSKVMLGFKDLFLLGFFLNIGLSGQPTLDIVLISLIFTAVILVKSVFFFTLLTRFKLRARTSLLATLNLTNYSEFGLIVAAIGVSNQWISNDWLIIISISMAMSFIIAAALNNMSHWLYSHHHDKWVRWQKEDRLDDDKLVDIEGTTIAIIGMGGIGTGAFDTMREEFGNTVMGIEIDPITAKNQQEMGRNVLLGDPSDEDFWDRVQASYSLELVMLILPNINTTLEVIERLNEVSYEGKIAAMAKFPDEVERLQDAGASIVYNIYSEAGVGFASHVTSDFSDSKASDSKIS